MPISRPPSLQPIPDHAKMVFKGKLFDVYQWEQPMYDGSVAIFEKIRRPDTVTIFPVLDDGRILLTEQEQPGKPPFIAATGGRVDEEEDILAAARRELLEETGYEADELILWKAEQPTSKIEWAVFTFVAKGLRKVAEQDLDPGEKIAFKPVTLDELLSVARTPMFSEREIRLDIVEAAFDPAKRRELEMLFAPKPKM